MKHFRILNCPSGSLIARRTRTDRTDTAWLQVRSYSRRLDFRFPYTLNFELPLSTSENKPMMDQEVCVCSSSSGESLAHCSLEDSITEEVLEEDGENEMVLVPRKSR